MHRIPARMDAVFATPRHRLRTLANAVRLHHWVKNVLVFVPLFTSRDLSNLPAVGKLLLMALALSLVASAQYLLNDLIDLDSDREHPDKRHRALASGDMPISVGMSLILCLLLIGGLVGYAADSWRAVMLLGVYFTSSAWYSAFLKTKPLVDVFSLAGLYVFRIVIGGFVSNHHATVWLLSFSFMCFLSLGFLKRCMEVAHAGQTATQRIGRRGYQEGDAPILMMMGVGSSFASAVVLALYVYSESANKLYAHPSALWGFVPLCLLLQCWLWLSGMRGNIKEDDPVRWVISDRLVWAIVGLSMTVYLLAAGWVS
ncbi:MAG: UbiA family prenyltransferase [Acidobacteriia bacterium]|nr:UbiA family prenyltransferase [Terriglobia bacterium]